MFVDYYELLEIDEIATFNEVKAAFRKQAIKWHPDRNPGKDTTERMQLINEAYLILKDAEGRNRFDKEYQIFKSFKQEKYEKEKFSTQQNQEKAAEPTETKTEQKTKYEFKEYIFKDDTLKKWMANAKKQAVDLAKQTIKEFGGMVAVGIEEGAKAAGKTLIMQVVIGVIIIIIFSLSRGCQS